MKKVLSGRAPSQAALILEPRIGSPLLPATIIPPHRLYIYCQGCDRGVWDICIVTYVEVYYPALQTQNVRRCKILSWCSQKWSERCWEILKPNKFCRTARCEVCCARKSTGLIYNVWGRRFSWTYGVCVSIMRPLEYNSYRHKLPRGGVRPTHALPKQYIRSKNAAQTDDRIVYLVNCISAHLVGYTLHCAMQRKFMYSRVRLVEQSGLHWVALHWRRRWFVYTLSAHHFLSPSHPSRFIHYLLSISLQNILYLNCGGTIQGMTRS